MELVLTWKGVAALMGTLAAIAGAVVGIIKLRRERKEREKAEIRENAVRENEQNRQISSTEGALQKHLDDCTEARRESAAATKELRDEMRQGFQRVHQRIDDLAAKRA